METIQENLIKKRFTMIQLILDILNNIMLYGKEKYAKVMSKAVGTICKLVIN